MSLVVEFAARVLLAAEDYCKEESKHGQLALECMLMRRSLITSLWSSNDGILNQIVGVGHKTTSKLFSNGIKTFNDVLSKSESEIEDASGRSTPFGKELRAAVSKLLARRLSVQTQVKDADNNSTNSVLICDISAHQSLDFDDNSRDIVQYTLVVYTDVPRGLLTFITDIVRPCRHRIDCPSQFGRLSVRLVSNVVGLDSVVEVWGCEKDDNTTPPTKQKKMRDESEASKSKDTIQAVPNLSVPYCKERGKFKKRAYFGDTSYERIEKNSTQNATIVTPLQKKDSQVSKLIRKCSSKSKNDGAIKTPTMLFNHLDGSQISKSDNIMTKVWQRQQKELQKSQQRAFSSRRENPFSSFKYDPNNCEKQLETMGQTAVSSGEKVECYYRDHQMQSSSVWSENRTYHSRWNADRGPTKRRKSISPSYNDGFQDLLKQKALEQEAYTYELFSNRGKLLSSHGNMGDQIVGHGNNARFSNSLMNPYNTQAFSWQQPACGKILEDSKMRLRLPTAPHVQIPLMSCITPYKPSSSLEDTSDNQFNKNPMCTSQKQLMAQAFCDDYPGADFSDRDEKILQHCELEYVHDVRGNQEGIRTFQDKVNPQGMIITIQSDGMDSMHKSKQVPDEFEDAFIP